MSYDYDKLYRDTPDALGPTSAAIAALFDGMPPSHVLDVGCGQGRDALALARRGHTVFGVDVSPNGIRQMLNNAQAEGLPITARVADIVEYVPERQFDVILLDRTLHMLGPHDQSRVLARLLTYVAPGGQVIIADERRNYPRFEAVAAASDQAWTRDAHRRGPMVIRRREPT